jgi:hypothetical protein
MFRPRAVLVSVLVVASVWSAPDARSAERPLRSGRIVSGVLTTSPSWDCWMVPDCAAWLASGCDPALAGRDPAWLASIVDVRDLADSETTRTFWYGTAEPAGFDPGGMTVEFWTDGCHEIWGRRFWDRNRDFPVKVPVNAAWMTVTANDKINAAWTLR